MVDVDAIIYQCPELSSGLADFSGLKETYGSSMHPFRWFVDVLSYVHITIHTFRMSLFFCSSARSVCTSIYDILRVFCLYIVPFQLDVWPWKLLYYPVVYLFIYIKIIYIYLHIYIYPWLIRKFVRYSLPVILPNMRIMFLNYAKFMPRLAGVCRKVNCFGRSWPCCMTPGTVRIAWGQG